MLVMVDDRQLVTSGYATGFKGEGMSTAGFSPSDFSDWLNGVSDAEVLAVEGFLIGDFEGRPACARLIRSRSRAPIIAMNDTQSLEQTLALFEAGVDDVVRKPIHVRELLARVAAIRRRVEADPIVNVEKSFTTHGDLRVYFDGRDPEVDGKVLRLPRRERRILEFLIRNRGRRVTKSQIFNSIYGIFDEDVEENVVESHVSKLRKKLRAHLGYDPIDSKRYLGYCIQFEGKRDEVDCPLAMADAA
jgi:two-component system, OmpR family, flagellar system response regulator FtcR